MELLALGGARPHGGVGVHPLAGRAPRQQLQEHLQVAPGGQDLLDADHADQRLGQGQAHAAVALGLQHHQGAGLGDHEVGPGDADLGGEEPLAKVQARGLGQGPRVVAQALGSGASPFGHVLAEDLPDLRAVAVDGRNQDVGRPVVAELHDQLGEVGLVGGDPGLGQRLVEADLLGGHRLDLDHLGLAGGSDQAGHDLVGLGGVRRPVHVAARAGDRLLDLEQVAVEVAQRVVLDRLARRAQLGPVGQLLDHGRPLGADRVRRLAEVVPELGVLECLLGVLREGGHAEEGAGAGHRASPSRVTGPPPSRRGSRPGA